VAKERGFYSLDLMEKIAREGTLRNIEGIPDDVRKVWVCSHDISYHWHVRMQVAFQRFTDNAVSKTINLPHTAPVDDVRQAYLAAWRMGLKGITVYRDASRVSQVLNIRKTDPTKQNQPDTEYGEPQVVAEQSIPSNTNGQKGVIAFPTTATTRTSKTKVTAAGDQSSNGISTLIGSTRIQTQAVEQSNIHKISEKQCTECGSASVFEARYEACVMCRVCGYTKC
jgi:ribonucleotide reductase alpha subunit